MQYKMYGINTFVKQALHTTFLIIYTCVRPSLDNPQYICCLSNSTSQDPRFLIISRKYFYSFLLLCILCHFQKIINLVTAEVNIFLAPGFTR